MSSSFPLTHAVTAGDQSAVSGLLANGADVNETNNGGQTALILAVIFGHTNLVELLMKAGADPQLRDDLGLNAIEWAQRRGLTEVLAILKNGPQSLTPPRRITIPLEDAGKVAPKIQQAKQVDESKETVSDEEKSRKWLAGLKRRLDEQESRRTNLDEQRRSEIEDPPPLMTVAPREVPVTEKPKAPEPERAKPEPAKPEPAKPEPVKVTRAAPRILTPPPTLSPASGKRKRCPQCNAIYTGDLVAYCAHHIVPLVDADEPVISESPKSNLPLFWFLVVITLTGSIVVGSLITTYLYNSNQAVAKSATDQQITVQKGSPELGGELVGKAVSLPEAECPVRGPEPVEGTVTVQVIVNKNGQVKRARGLGGDWLMRGSATEAAMKSTFAPEKLRGRETEGTITYTFKPSGATKGTESTK